MSEFMKLAIVFISMLVLFYFLWVNGYMILNAKRALLFVVSLRGKNKCEVSFSSCSGYVKKVIKFNESRYYRNLLGGLYRENPVKSRNYEAVKSSKKWENVGNSYIIPALLLYRYSYI